jgi:DNA replication protein DnaC
MKKMCRCGKEYEAGEGIFTIPVCPDCASEWDNEIEARLPKRMSQTELDENVLLESLGIRPRHYGCTFDTFKPRDDDETKTLAVCRKMANSKRGIVALIGNNGTGKTHLACATVRTIGSGRIYKMIEIGMFIRKAFDHDRKLDEQTQLDYLVRLPFLAIDEADKSKRTDNEMNWLSYLIDERNEHYRPTIIIANCHPRSTHDNGTTCERCFESIMTPDVLDRITQSGVIRYFNGESNRRTLRGKD